MEMVLGLRKRYKTNPCHPRHWLRSIHRGMEGVMVEWLLINAHGTGVMVSVKRVSGTSITPPGLQKIERRGHVPTRRLAVPVRRLVVRNNSLLYTRALRRV